MATHADLEGVGLPHASRLIHIGPPKTGTSELQMAFHLQRKELRELGVHYPVRGPQPGMAARYISGMPGPPGSKTPSVKSWNKLVRQVSRSDARIVVVSSEFFATCPDEAAAEVVASLGGPQAHIALTLRPLASILPSAWQQYIRNGLRLKYQRWLEEVLTGDQDNLPTPSFWRLHRDDELIARWSRVVDADRVHVIVPPPPDPDLRIRAFEALTGLPSGTLRPAPDARNRALTAAEAAYVRALNNRLHLQELSPAVRRQITVKTVVPTLLALRPDPAERPILTPDWAVDRATEIGAAAARRIATLGVRVIGDLSALSARVEDPDVAIEPLALPVSVAAAATTAAIRAVMDLAATGPEDGDAAGEEVAGEVVR